jgi:hypothetical protein
LDTQLEDNTTKALINVLQHSAPELTTTFLHSVADQKVVPVTKFEYYLQRRPDSTAEMKLLLGLSNRVEIDASSWTAASSGSRVDGSIHLPGVLTILIETKIDDPLNGSQLQRHATDCGMPQAVFDGARWVLPPEWKIRSWTQVYKWARQKLCTTARQPDRFLLEQLVEYLELAGLAPTWTLRTEHFDLFREPAQKRDGAIAAEIRARLRSIWSRVEEKIGSNRFREVLGEVRVGNLGEGANHAWAQSNAEEGCNLPNLTIEMDKDELHLNIVGGYDRQAECLKEWLLKGDSSGLAQAEYELAVFHRTAKGGLNGKKIVWQGAAWELIARIPLAGLTPTTLENRLADWRKPLDRNTQRLAFHIRRAWGRDRVIDQENLPEVLAAEIQRLLPSLELIRKMSTSRR